MTLDGNYTPVLAPAEVSCCPYKAGPYNMLSSFIVRGHISAGKELLPPNHQDQQFSTTVAAESGPSPFALQGKWVQKKLREILQARCFCLSALSAHSKESVVSYNISYVK